MAGSWKKNGDFERVANTRNHFVCQWCGKHFIAANAHPHKYCSEECKKSAQKAYNTKWVAEKRKNETLSEEQLEKRRATTRKSYARKVWNRWVDEADNIVKLVEDTAGKGFDVRRAVAKYLSDNFRYKTARETTPDFSSITSANTADKKIAESLGDTLDN